MLSYLRRYKDRAVLVALNMSPETQTMDFDPTAQGFVTKTTRTLLATDPQTSDKASLSRLPLGPFSVYIGAITKTVADK